MIKITQNGRPFNAKGFAEGLMEKALEVAMHGVEEKARGAASSIVDPETGRHAEVFVDRLPGNRVAVRTAGSSAFARLLEQRLGIGVGDVSVMSAPAKATPIVYLAHAHEDKVLVRPIAEHLMANGIEVWFDEWEIGLGDSLRQKMESGLTSMTHFAVVLTPTSITKPWVAKEIDVGMVQLVGGESKFLPLVVGLDPTKLSPFLRTMMYLKLDPLEVDELKGLADRIHGVSQKPALGTPPSYVKPAPAGLSGWSSAAIEVGKLLISKSKNALSYDPIMTIDDIAKETGLTVDDTRLAVLDLKDAGYLWEGRIPGHVAPEKPLFTDFDEEFMEFRPSEDASVVANRMMTAETDATATSKLAEELNWQPRRMNSAICYLERAGAIELRHALMSSPWRSIQLVRTSRTLRFARSRN